MKIEKVLTDNGSQFTDRFTRKDKAPSGKHAFDRECALLGIEHRLIKPRHPQTHGMVERFNARTARCWPPRGSVHARICKSRWCVTESFITTIFHNLHSDIAAASHTDLAGGTARAVYREETESGDTRQLRKPKQMLQKLAPYCSGVHS